jgi:hypothetical protein
MFGVFKNDNGYDIREISNGDDTNCDDYFIAEFDTYKKALEFVNDDYEDFKCYLRYILQYMENGIFVDPIDQWGNAIFDGYFDSREEALKEYTKKRKLYKNKMKECFVLEYIIEECW